MLQSVSDFFAGSKGIAVLVIGGVIALFVFYKALYFMVRGKGATALGGLLFVCCLFGNSTWQVNNDHTAKTVLHGLGWTADFRYPGDGKCRLGPEDPDDDSLGAWLLDETHFPNPKAQRLPCTYQPAGLGRKIWDVINTEMTLSAEVAERNDLTNTEGVGLAFAWWAFFVLWLVGKIPMAIWLWLTVKILVFRGIGNPFTLELWCTDFWKQFEWWLQLQLWGFTLNVMLLWASGMSL